MELKLLVTHTVWKEAAARLMDADLGASSMRGGCGFQRGFYM